MTRIAEFQLARGLLGDILENKERYNKYSNEASSGYKVTDPGDSKFSATISAYRETLSRIEGHKTRISAVQGLLSFQDSIMKDAADQLVRAKELAAQGANETLGAEQRAQISKEVFEIRDHLVTLANSKYQGKYVYNGAMDNIAPYQETAAGYTLPVSTTDPAHKHYAYTDTTANPGATLGRAINLTDDLSITLNTNGSTFFDNAIQALERLGRALAGYGTTPATGAPDGGGAAYNLPSEQAAQTYDIKAAMDLLETARQEDIMPEQVSIGAKLTRLETAQSMIGLTKSDAEKVLSDLQNADLAETSVNLQQAQTALEASYMVSARILQLSVLDYL